MKFSAQEEYGIRCLVAIARRENVTIPELSRSEGLTEAHVAKLLMELRKGGFITSTRGQVGGYKLGRPMDEISLSVVVAHLGGRLYDQGFCERHSGRGDVCTHHGGCSIRSLWSRVQDAVDAVLDNVSIGDIVRGEAEESTVELMAVAPAGIRGRGL